MAQSIYRAACRILAALRVAHRLAARRRHIFFCLRHAWP